MYNKHFFPAHSAIKSCNGVGKVKYTAGEISGSLVDFLLKKKKSLGGKDHDFSPDRQKFSFQKEAYASVIQWLDSPQHSKVLQWFEEAFFCWLNFFDFCCSTSSQFSTAPHRLYHRHFSSWFAGSTLHPSVRFCPEKFLPEPVSCLASFHGCQPVRRSTKKCCRCPNSCFKFSWSLAVAGKAKY